MFDLKIDSKELKPSLINEQTLYGIIDKAQRYDKLAMMFKVKEVCCSFCGKSQSAVKTIIAGPGVYICNECVELCDEILRDRKENKEVNRCI